MKTNIHKPVIGVTMKYDRDGLVHAGIDYSIIRHEYGEQLKSAGASPIFLDDTIDPEVAAELCDGIVISGGEDIDPAFYGQDPIHVKAFEPEERTVWELALIKACNTKGTRILGICYGMQLLNVYYNGTLYQDIALETGSKVDHGKSTAPAIHTVAVNHDFLYFERGEKLATAHRHHQAVNKLGRGLKVVAEASDGTVEAIVGHGHFGVQWHAESDGTAAPLYGAFVAIVAGLEDTDSYAVPQPVLRPGLATS